MQGQRLLGILKITASNFYPFKEPAVQFVAHFKSLKPKGNNGAKALMATEGTEAECDEADGEDSTVI